jgi:hypothetical protein
MGPVVLLLTVLSRSALAQPSRVDIRLNPAVTQESVRETICVVGWTRLVRPSTAYTHGVKQELLRALELPSDSAPRYELDHRIPLSLGGAPYQRDNLELQPWDEAPEKDRKETCLSRAVCAGRLTLAAARERIWGDWRNVGAGCD